MVRLQLSNSCFRKLILISFNPTMVRLQPLYDVKQLPPETPFNPTMVRLQPSCHTHTERLQLAFQSHYGAIATSF